MVKDYRHLPPPFTSHVSSNWRGPKRRGHVSPSSGPKLSSTPVILLHVRSFLFCPDLPRTTQTLPPNSLSLPPPPQPPLALRLPPPHPLLRRRLPCADEGGQHRCTCVAAQPCVAARLQGRGFGSYAATGWGSATSPRPSADARRRGGAEPISGSGAAAGRGSPAGAQPSHVLCPRRDTPLPTAQPPPVPPLLRLVQIPFASSPVPNRHGDYCFPSFFFYS